MKDPDGIGRVGMKRFDWCRSGRIELRLTNTLNSHTGPRNAIQGSTDWCLDKGTQDCQSQMKAYWTKHVWFSYSSSTTFAQLQEHPIQTERLCETMNFNNEFAAPLISIRRAPQNDPRVLSLSLIEDFSCLITQAAAHLRKEHASIDLKNGIFSI